jgi:microcystin degradation protein MlrC
MTETNSFSPIATSLESFQGSGFAEAGMPLDSANPLDSGLAAIRDFTEARGGTFVAGMRAFAQPSAPVDATTWHLLKSRMLADIAGAMPVNMVVLGLHGAMMAEGEPDCEGDLLASVRSLVGPEVVISAWLDPHAHLSERMTSNADILVFYKEYPHTDMDARAVDAISLAWRTWAGEITPVMMVRDLNMIRFWPTQHAPLRGFVDHMLQLEQEGAALSISFVHGFPWGDSPDIGSRILVITDGDRAVADRLATELGDALWTMRHAEDVQFLAADEAIDLALSADRGPVVLADFADNPGGGAAQDSTFLLQLLMARNADSAAIAALFDPAAVQACFSAGIGQRLRLSVGGKHGRQSGQPVEADFDVMALVEDLRQSSFTDGSTLSLGRSAWIRTGGIDLILCSIRGQIISHDVFSHMGIDPTARQILVVKSSNHFHASFSRIAARIHHVTTPGTLNMDLATIPLTQLSKPLWPREPG